jgi:hypothetical protein
MLDTRCLTPSPSRFNNAGTSTSFLWVWVCQRVSLCTRSLCLSACRLPIWSVARSLTQTTHTPRRSRRHTLRCKPVVLPLAQGADKRGTHTHTNTRYLSRLAAAIHTNKGEGASAYATHTNIRQTQTRKLTHFHSHTCPEREIENTYTHTIPFGAHGHGERCKETHKACCPRQRDAVRRQTKQQSNKATKLAVLHHPPSVISQQQHAEEPPPAPNLLVLCFTQKYDLINLGMLLALLHSQV